MQNESPHQGRANRLPLGLRPPPTGPWLVDSSTALVVLFIGSTLAAGADVSQLAPVNDNCVDAISIEGEGANSSLLEMTSASASGSSTGRESEGSLVSPDPDSSIEVSSESL